MRFLKRSGILEKDAPKEKSSSPCEVNPKEDSFVATQAARMSPATTDQAGRVHSKQGGVDYFDINTWHELGEAVAN